MASPHFYTIGPMASKVQGFCWESTMSSSSPHTLDELGLRHFCVEEEWFDGVNRHGIESVVRAAWQL